MSQYTAREVEAATEAYAVEVPTWNGEGTYTSEWSWDEASYVDDEYKYLEINGERVPYEVVEEDTGGEGHGEYVYVVIRVGDQLFRKEGYYASHYGTDWDGSLEEVEAYQKQVTAYRPV